MEDDEGEGVSKRGQFYGVEKAHLLFRLWVGGFQYCFWR
jgi:hypothetical protein